MNAQTILARLLQNGADATYQELLRTNPQFAQFVRQNQNRTPEEIARSYGVNLNLLGQLINGGHR